MVGIAFVWKLSYFEFGHSFPIFDDDAPTLERISPE